MPRLDHTGPTGQGPLTGRKMGRCTSESQEPTDSFIPRRWFDRLTGRGGNRNQSGPFWGAGRGRGRR
ncbi:MAG TPA: DUF5320 domain-containing protein [Mariniphaga sp.]|nr:DUF5320 domain-containing protein [Mariniphaga sp.]